MLIACTLVGSTAKLFKSFAVNYISFIILEMIDAGFSSTVYPAVLILALEWSKTENRNLISALAVASYPFGQIINALIASYTHNFRWMLRIASLFGFVLITYIWTLSESLRWLLVNRKHKEAIKVVKKAAKLNGINISQRTFDIIGEKCKNEIAVNDQNKCGESLIDVLKNPSLFMRFLICIICWIISTLVTYGVSIASVSLQGDKYVNFMIIAMGATPSVFLTYLMLRYVRRRFGLCISFLVTGLSIIASQLFSSMTSISLTCFFLGKFFIHHSFTSLYVYTSELWPTSIRHSVMGVCSMIGRFGSIVAPMTPMLVSL